MLSVGFFLVFFLISFVLLYLFIYFDFTWFVLFEWLCVLFYQNYRKLSVKSVCQPISQGQTVLKRKGKQILRRLVQFIIYRYQRGLLFCYAFLFLFLFFLQFG